MLLRMTNLNDLTSRYIELSHKVQKEQNERELVKNSGEYLQLDDMRCVCQIKMDDMLETVQDSSSELSDIKDELIKAFREKGVLENGIVKAKTQKRKEVRLGKLLDVMQGDIGQFCDLAKVTQVSLTKYAKEQDEDYKRSLLGCIEETGEVITDFELKTNSL
jgi:hypothetical protein